MLGTPPKGPGGIGQAARPSQEPVRVKPSDNEAVSTNSSVPESTLNKRHNSICYHMVRETVAAGVLSVAWIPGTKNPADLFTKVLGCPSSGKALLKLRSVVS